MSKITEEAFYEMNPQINHIVRAETAKSVADEDICSFGGTMYETYGLEEEYIRQMAQDEKTKKRVWTVLDCDGELIIAAGFHFVNRMGYIITEKEWTTGEEEVENDF
jgi:surface polysaccharide O-acyltransferase-like enzyme